MTGTYDFRPFPLPTLVVDLDGTLLACGRYYKAANDDVADALADQLDIDRELVLELIEYLDVWAIRIRQKDGFKKERFPKSLAGAAAAAQMIAEPNGWIYPSVMQWAHSRGMDVFDFEKTPYEPFEGAIETLQAYKDAGWRIVVCTKGDPEVQHGKLAHHGIDKIAHEIQVVPRKNADVLRHLCDTLRIDPANAVYVGDSVRDDITPAKEVGMRAVRIRVHPQDVWTHDSQPDALSDHVIDSFKDLPSVVPLGAR